MSRNGSGTYNLPSGNPVVTATTITSTWANTTLSDIATALTGSLAADGQTPATGNLNMNTNQIKNVVDPTLAQDAATKAYVDASIPSASTFLLKASNLSDVANATTARGNLSAAKSGANSDITSLTACTSITGLTTALSAAQGGTGLTAPGTSGNILTSNGTAWTSAAPAAGPYVGQRGQVFTSSGTFTIPTGVTAIKMTVQAGGGSGTDQTGGLGGAAGGAAVKYLTGLTSGNTLSVTVGAAGGTSQVASGTQTITTVSATGSGGIGSNGDLNIRGNAGQTYDSSLNIGGNGGSSFLGFGGAGGSGGGGGSAGGYGGGGGCGTGSSGGGGGGAGVVMIEW